MVIQKIHGERHVFFLRHLIVMLCFIAFSVVCGLFDSRSIAAQQAAGNETGRYFALVIGIDKYPSPIPQLHTAVSDAHAMADVLQKQYGFQVALLTDAKATRAGILDQLAAYQAQLAPGDNLLIYYAGHGYRIEEANKSFWLPVDATSKLSSNRISADDLTTEMATMKARHVLVISDSCYSGGLTRDLLTVSEMKPDDAFLRKTLSMKSRNIMASGGDEPVADGGPAGHSVFAWALLQALAQQTDSLFTASDLFYGKVRRAVAGNAEQIPVYQPIRNSGDMGGDFVFRKTAATRTEVETRLTATTAALGGYDRGLAFYRSRDYTRAASALSESCATGDPRSCFGLGYMYRNGSGVSRDDVQAVTLYRRSCEGGDARGCNNLGGMYAYGLGIAKDVVQAALLYRKGCDGGDARGCSSLGLMYESGSGVTKNDMQAVELYRKSCEGGSSLGCSYLGVMYEHGSGVTRDYAQAVLLYRKGCDSGYARSCSCLGTMYTNGWGVTRDYAEGLALYRKGCSGGDSYGCSTFDLQQKRSQYHR